MSLTYGCTRANPDPSELTRTELVREIYGTLAAWILVKRTDTGTYYIVSTNDSETLTVESDALGTWPHPVTDILPCSGSGMTRTDAILRLDEIDLCEHKLERPCWQCEQASPETCDECGNDIPDSAPRMMNEFHAESCSLYSGNTTG